MGSQMHSDDSSSESPIHPDLKETVFFIYIGYLTFNYFYII